MLRTNATLLTRLQTRNFSALARQLGPLDVVSHDAELSELLVPAPEAPRETRRFPTPTEDAFLYDASDAQAYQRQLRLEEETVHSAVARYKRLAEDAAARGDVWSHRPAAALVGSWVGPVALAVRKAQEVAPSGEARRQSVQEEAQPLLKLLPPDVLTVIVIHEVFGALMRDVEGVKLTSLAISVGNAVRAEVNAAKLLELNMKQRAMESC